VTDEQLSEIEARANAATKGPWIASVDEEHERWRLLGPIGSAGIGGFPIREHIADAYDGTKESLGPNGWFIREAREDIPALLAYIKLLNAYIDDRVEEYGRAQNEITRLSTRIAELEAAGRAYTPGLSGMATAIDETQKEMQ